MKNSTIRKLEERAQNFQGKDNPCPVCKKTFRHCPHSFGQAVQRLNDIAFQAKVDRAVKQALKKIGN